VRLLLPGGRALPAPHLIAKQRGRRRLSSSANQPPSSENVARTTPTPTALLDPTTTAALPRDRVHLTHGTCRRASKSPCHRRCPASALVPARPPAQSGASPHCPTPASACGQTGRHRCTSHRIPRLAARSRRRCPGRWRMRAWAASPRVCQPRPQLWLKKPFSMIRARSSAETSTLRGVSRNTLSAIRCMPPSSA
jgi:hypothetical protein